jgi:hypothetical protein
VGTGVARRKRSRATLRTLEDAPVELARLYRRAERGQIPIADASRLTHILTSLGKVLEAAVIEARLNALHPDDLAMFGITTTDLHLHPSHPVDIVAKLRAGLDEGEHSECSG